MRRPGFSRRAFTGGAAAAAIAPAGLTAALRSTSEPAAAPRAEVRRITMYAENLPNGQLGYGLAPGEAQIPGPLLEMYEGDTLQIDLVNNADVAVSLHVHGVDYTIDSDGTRMTNSIVEPGESRLYTWNSHAPGTREDGTAIAGSAGYWNYHDHVVGTDHGTGGLQKGLYGPLVVRRQDDIVPDHQFTVVFNDMTTNNRTQAPNFTAKLGERCEFIVITHGELYHTFHVHGHRWADNRTGYLAGPDDTSQVIDNKICGPGDSFGFQVVAGENVGPGHWMYHCHVQSHSDMGMAGHFTVTRADGSVPGGDPGHGGHGADTAGAQRPADPAGSGHAHH
ncbi:multicopper oxidase domain-containing protein [Streptomyces johnsoniae]|uniref:Multicopper oxidase domain-containing protein n=1 Tax=Streptomyces johnsoniae TaxID=3075532 RepID=A0ABU2SGZ6_9ACTN|nr:multicopper oxidase domain-containing protein [Streptomyces sp. DSM 41886]MDT0447350.1 multicopper oxidase domain-containing protein [Streptomyces sp. DSM 41886]